jgi:multidrug efflux pump subunit AcrA (membrane-fusion protein)
MKILNIIKNKLLNIFKSLKNKSVLLIKKYPLPVFFILLALLFGLILLGNTLRKPTAQETKQEEAIAVDVYKIGQAPRITVNAQVQKSGVINITALAPGVVQQIFRYEGEQVGQGSSIVRISSNYQGGTLQSVQRQLAQAQYNNVNDTYDYQREIIQKQKEVASLTDENADKLREITDKSLSETRDSLSLNENILDTINSNLKTLEEATNSSQNQTLILTTKQLKSQYLSAVNQLRSALRNAEYQASSDNPGAKLSILQKEITLKQLEIQEKSLDLSKEVSRLNLRIAQVNEALMFPAAPFAGSIERIHVKVGQAVNPGQLIATLNGNSQNLTAVALVSRQIAENISKLEESSLSLDDKTYEMIPCYVSKEATNGQLYSIIYNLPSEYNSSLKDQEYIQVSIPVGYPDTGAAIPFIPLESIYQTQDNAYLLIYENGKAVSRQVTLGKVFGRFVEISQGLSLNEQVILNRNVIEGDSVNLSQN